MENTTEETWKSRSQKKREDKDLQSLGLKLANLGKEAWVKLPLSDEILEALNDYASIRGHGARLRHEKHIGKLLREEDPENRAVISAFSNRFEGKKREERDRHQRLESLRDRLVSGDHELLEKLAELPSLDPGQLALLTDQAKKEVGTGKTGGARKALFRYLAKRLPVDF